MANDLKTVTLQVHVANNYHHLLLFFSGPEQQRVTNVPDTSRRLSTIAPMHGEDLWPSMFMAVPPHSELATLPLSGRNAGCSAQPSVRREKQVRKSRENDLNQKDTFRRSFSFFSHHLKTYSEQNLSGVKMVGRCCCISPGSSNLHRF